MLYAVIKNGRGATVLKYDFWEIMPEIYEIGVDQGGSTWCSCLGFGRHGNCKHLEMYRDRKRKPGLWYDDVQGIWIKAELV